MIAKSQQRRDQGTDAAKHGCKLAVAALNLSATTMQATSTSTLQVYHANHGCEALSVELMFAMATAYWRNPRNAGKQVSTEAS